MEFMIVPLTKLSKIIGQNQPKELMLRSFGKGTMSHAYIFRGPSGVGKKTMAFSFAAFINCRKRGENDFCGVCSSCLKFASGNHPDFHFIEPDGTAIKIEQVRELKKALTFPPFEAEYRVVLFPDIHVNMKRREVANSLLKTLEEPPANTMLILTADEAGEVLPTILSRGQIIRFLPLDYEAVGLELLERKEMGREEALTLAAVSGGSLGKALALADQQLLGLRVQLVDSIMTLDKNHGDAVEKVFFLAEQISGLKDGILDFLSLLRLWLRDLILYEAVNNQDVIVNHDLRHTYEAALKRWSASDLFNKILCIDRAKKQLDRNCNRVSVCEVLIWDFL